MELLTSFGRLRLSVLAFIAKDLPGGVFGETSGLHELVVYLEVSEDFDLQHR